LRVSKFDWRFPKISGEKMNERDFDDGLRQVLVCTYGEDCANATKARHGSDTAVFDAIKAVRKETGLNRKLYVLRTSCQGWCEYAPVCTVLPEGKVVQGITPEGAAEFVRAVVERDDKAFKNEQIWDLSQSHDENMKNKL
jgi:(2Fe-2S) ferredoxin